MHCMYNLEIKSTIAAYKAEKLSIHLPVCLHFWHADNSVMSALIEVGLN